MLRVEQNLIFKIQTINLPLTTHDERTFEKIDYSEKTLSKREFINCEFIDCNFQKSDLSHNDFMDCIFTRCNFSLAVLNGTGIKNAQFIDCKLMGIDFSRCNPFLFSVSFQNCHLDYCSFFQLKLKKTTFSNCSVKEVDFAETDLSMAVFKECDLLNTSFIRSILEKTDFRTAINYAFDPELNKIKKAKFSLPGVTGLLSKYQIDIEY